MEATMVIMAIALTPLKVLEMDRGRRDSVVLSGAIMIIFLGMNKE